MPVTLGGPLVPLEEKMSEMEAVPLDALANLPRANFFFSSPVFVRRDRGLLSFAPFVLDMLTLSM